MYLSTDNLRSRDDIQDYFTNLSKRLFINYHRSFFDIFSNKNWLIKSDVETFLNLSGYEIISNRGNRIIAKKRQDKIKEYSVSIIIPARNEEKNIPNIIPSIPKFGKSQEIIFVEGGSSDKTWQEIVKIKGVVKIKQRGKGKANAIRLGLSKAKGEILMIYDSDRTIDAKELIKFYKVLSNGTGEFINGSRLVYPMEKDAMRTLNKIGNICFSYLFTWIFGQNFKDTLCGTKAFFKKDYVKFKKLKDDPFGDFELIFGAIENNLKVVEIPAHYKERVYGSTNIKRFYHGLLLLKMVLIAFWQFRIRRSSLR